MEYNLSNEDFGLKLYNRFPPKYREDDVAQRYALRRYLQTAGDGGFKYSIDEINGIMSLIDYTVTDPEVLKVLLLQYGFEYFHGVPIEYLRNLLPMLSEAYSRKGSISVVEFVATITSGILSHVTVEYDENGVPKVMLNLEMDFALSDRYPTDKQFKRILKNFIPFYALLVLVYTYVYTEEQRISAFDEMTFMEINESREEVGIFYSGLPDNYLLNVSSKLLNKTFILNGSSNSVDPVQFFDIIEYRVNEKGVLDDSLSEIEDTIVYPVEDESGATADVIVKDAMAYKSFEESSIIGDDSYCQTSLQTALIKESAVLNLYNYKGTFNVDNLNDSFILNNKDDTCDVHKDTINTSYRTEFAVLVDEVSKDLYNLNPVLVAGSLHCVEVCSNTVTISGQDNIRIVILDTMSRDDTVTLKHSETSNISLAEVAKSTVTNKINESSILSIKEQRKESITCKSTEIRNISAVDELKDSVLVKGLLNTTFRLNSIKQQGDITTKVTLL